MPKSRLVDKSNSRRGEYFRVALALCGLLAVTSCHRHSSATTPTPKADTDEGQPPPPPSAPPATKPRPSSLPLTPPPLTPEQIQLREVMKLDSQGKMDEALTVVNPIIEANPKNFSAYNLRGEIYTKKKQWDLAQLDYETILKSDNKNVPAKFNLAELKFMQKDYDNARPAFLALKADKDWGDLAAYRIYLCDLYGGHAEAAQADLDAFNKAGSNPSFYFGNAAWHFYNKQPDEGYAWLNKGRHIYAPWKAALYSSSLEELGYIPGAASPTPATSN